MAKLIYGLNQSLDGYIDHTKFPEPKPVLFRHFTAQVRDGAGMIYGRGMYEVMRYWDDDHAEWGDDERAYATVWRGRPKWVVSRTLKTVGPNATLIAEDVETVVRKLRTELDGEIGVAGNGLAHSLTQAGLIDEYQIYLHPVVLGGGKPFFAGPRSPLRLVGNERIDGDVIRLRYVPV